MIETYVLVGRLETPNSSFIIPKKGVYLIYRPKEDPYAKNYDPGMEIYGPAEIYASRYAASPTLNLPETENSFTADSSAIKLARDLFGYDLRISDTEMISRIYADFVVMRTRLEYLDNFKK